ncbi:MAG: T9SS type A sorting domain-containing protein, partial [Bacteroidia bacterium]
TKTISILVKPTPTLSYSAAPSLTLCPGGSTTLTAVSSAGNYSWSPGGQTTSAITVTPAISTVYNVATTNSVGCTTNSNVTVFVVVCTGLAKNTIIDKDTFIYPNPNNGNINVLIQDANGSYSFEINDLSGRLVYKATLTNVESALNIKELANGMYTYKITSLITKTSIKEGKLIKE